MLHSFDSTLEKLHGYETDFVKILYYDLPGNYSGMYQSHSYTRFCTILEGEKHITVKNKSFTYNRNQSLLLPAYSKVYMNIAKPTKALVFELNNDLIDSVVQKSTFSLPKEVDFTSSKEILLSNLERSIQTDIGNLMTTSTYPNEKEPFLIDLYAQKLIYDLLSMNQTSSALLRQTYTPMDTVLQYIQDNISRSLTISELAGLLNMSTSNFSHSFKKYVGTSPQKYMHHLKLTKAKELLFKSSVTETAFDLGYENPSHFIRRFKDLHGITPKQFQLQNRISSQQ